MLINLMVVLGYAGSLEKLGATKILSNFLFKNWRILGSEDAFDAFKFHLEFHSDLSCRLIVACISVINTCRLLGDGNDRLQTRMLS